MKNRYVNFRAVRWLEEVYVIERLSSKVIGFESCTSVSMLKLTPAVLASRAERRQLSPIAAC